MNYVAPLAALALLASAPAAHAAFVQSPAYKDCANLAKTNPAMALARAEEWARIDTGIPAQHCRAMALYGLGRYDEAGQALAQLRDAVPAEDADQRAYITKQAVQAWRNANRTDAALAILSTQISDMGRVRGDNAAMAKLTSDLLLERARILTTYGKMGDAVADLDHAVSLTPLNEEVLLERAGTFEQMGDVALAAEDVKAVLRLNAGNAKARLMQDRLKKAGGQN